MPSKREDARALVGAGYSPSWAEVLVVEAIVVFIVLYYPVWKLKRKVSNND